MIARTIPQVAQTIHTAKSVINNIHDNPFSQAFENAAIVGNFIADIIIHNFEGYFINLVGFSLGT